jgi:hypothetical protein
MNVTTRSNRDRARQQPALHGEDPTLSAADTAAEIECALSTSSPDACKGDFARVASFVC